MLTAKEEVKKNIDHLPDDVGYEDIQYHIHVRKKIERGLNDIRNGNVLSQEEVEKGMSKWLVPSFFNRTVISSNISDDR